MYKDYNMNQVTLSLDLEIYLGKDDLAFAINNLVESIPEKAFAAFEHQMGATSYHPKMMLKLILCGYTQSIFSSRRIEALAKDSIRARWLTQSHQPNFRTIDRFRVHPHVQVLLEVILCQDLGQVKLRKLDAHQRTSFLDRQKNKETQIFLSMLVSFLLFLRLMGQPCILSELLEVIITS
ncbi:transposase [Vagococcus elongatus]|uniref:Transposase InsH N-terminal domain-containing protein n=1 Tax=Vagococcus elongatus TaxID=180344 RepID=A0A430ASE6_9ENTE|nr:transposase [Vagococcus elongatus]RSU10987.1 hypothetical protein CBF29_08470 [Vagococcus elongatus]